MTNTQKTKIYKLAYEKVKRDKKEEIINIILSKKDVYSTGVHFGSLSIQPMDRCLNHNETYEKKDFVYKLNGITSPMI